VTSRWFLIPQLLQ